MHKDFVVIVTALINGNTVVLGVIKDRLKDTVKKFLKGIPANLKATIRSVCTDMYDGYINAGKEVLGRKVKIVIDRFHIAKAYRKCVDDLTKKELKRLKKELSAEDYKELKGAMWALRNTDLSEEETSVLACLFICSPTLKHTYDFQNELTTIFNGNHDRSTAIRKIWSWQRRVRKRELSCFGKFLTTFRQPLGGYCQLF